jgi:hypothetical protein
MQSAIPNYLKPVASLQAALAQVFEGKSRRTKKDAAAGRRKLQPQCRFNTFEDHRSKRCSKIYKQLSWSQRRCACKLAIMESMTLAFPGPDKRICVLADASDRFYAGLVTNIDEEQLDIPMEEQDHQPLAFLSREFKGAQLR